MKVLGFVVVVLFLIGAYAYFRTRPTRGGSIFSRGDDRSEQD